MPNQIFTREYKALKATLAAGGFGAGTEAVKAVSDLKLLLASTGPDKAHAALADGLRTRYSKGEKESTAILADAGGGAGHQDRCAVLKTFRHLRLIKKFGNHGLWVMFMPKDFTDWSSELLSGLDSASLAAKLDMTNEYWNADEVSKMADSTQDAVAWAQKASALCAKEEGNELVKRWFADEDSQSDAALATSRATLVAGFNKIATMALSENLILTKLPWRTVMGTEAAVAKAEKLNVIYIEPAFFGTSNTLSGKVNWARIMVHELSHRAQDTDDVITGGQMRYSHHPKGLSPHKTDFPTAKTLKNADNWAFFAADAAGQLTAKNIIDALKAPST